MDSTRAGPYAVASSITLHEPPVAPCNVTLVAAARVLTTSTLRAPDASTKACA